MIRTRLTDRLGIRLPIIQAPMAGGISGSRLVLAVLNAGGLGMLPIWSTDRESATHSLREIKEQSDAPFAVNLNVAFDPAAMLDLALEFAVPVVHFFWGNCAPYVGRAKSRGAIVMATVASASEGRRARDAGADVLIAQGIEAGGHVWGKTSLMALVPAVADACPECPVVATGAIADGRGFAAALMLGADGAMIGTALAASEESGAHPEYKRALVNAADDDTALGTLFDIGWPDAPSRVLRNKTTENAQRQGSSQQRPGEGEIVGQSETGMPIPRYSALPPTEGTSGDIAAMALYAGQGVGLVKRIEPAAQILLRLVSEAEKLMKNSGSARQAT